MGFLISFLRAQFLITLFLHPRGSTHLNPIGVDNWERECCSYSPQIRRPKWHSSLCSPKGKAYPTVPSYSPQGQVWINTLSVQQRLSVLLRNSLPFLLDILGLLICSKSINSSLHTHHSCTHCKQWSSMTWSWDELAFPFHHQHQQIFSPRKLVGALQENKKQYHTGQWDDLELAQKDRFITCCFLVHADLRPHRSSSHTEEDQLSIPLSLLRF